jgi:hypothetical protein
MTALSALRDQFKISVRQLDAEQLLRCVQYLGQWDNVREAIVDSKTNDLSALLESFNKQENVDMGHMDRTLLEITDILHKESFFRLFSRGDENLETYINDHQLLCDLSKVWSKIDPTCNYRSFPCTFIRKWMDESRSKRLLKDIAPKTFIDVMWVTWRVKALPDKYHKYYAIYKFYDLLDSFTLDEVNVVMKCFHKHSIAILKTHPMNKMLMEGLLQKLTREAHLITSENSKATLKYMSVHINVGDDWTSEDLVTAFQQAIVDRGKRDSLELTQLVEMTVLNRFRGPVPGKSDLARHLE